MTDFRPLKQEAIRCLPRDHPIRQLMVAEPDHMPFDEFAKKIVRYILVAIDYRHNTRKPDSGARK
jgi:hypothetical protein